MVDLRIATRRSPLALAQARWVADRLNEHSPGMVIDLVEITTAGDRDRSSAIAGLTEVGAFVRAVQHAVLDGRADVAVHSSKDLPVTGPAGLHAVYPERLAPWDVVCGSRLDDLAAGSRVGTGSPRRRSQLLALRPDLDVVDVRGNVDTRLGRVASGELDAVVLAEAGLTRMGLAGEVAQRLTLDEMVPAPGQGALAVETAGGGPAAAAALIEHPPTRRAVTVERTVLARSGAGCRAALGVLAVPSGEVVTMTGFVEDDRGRRRASVAADDGTVADRMIEALRL
jgi:hydroxymethylbilane synthase